MRSRDSSGLRPLAKSRPLTSKAYAFGALRVACVGGRQVAGHRLGQRRLKGGCHPDHQDQDDADGAARLHLLVCSACRGSTPMTSARDWPRL
jgi:hypothetical protein